jgi:hypothetical protein
MTVEGRTAAAAIRSIRVSEVTLAGVRSSGLSGGQVQRLKRRTSGLSDPALDKLILQKAARTQS